MHLILASRSSARAELLLAGGYRFKQITSGIREKPRAKNQLFEAWLAGLAAQKALAVARRYPDAYVIGCDTGILFHGKILGKAGTVRQAVTLLTLLADKTHRISTAVCVLSPRAYDNGKPFCYRILTGVDSAQVTFRALSHRDILRYVETTKPFSYAGAYAVQSGGAAIIRRIAGDPTTVIGLPMGLLQKLLKRSGYRPKDCKRPVLKF